MKLHRHVYDPHPRTTIQGVRFPDMFLPHGHCRVCEKIKYDWRTAPNGGYMWFGGNKYWLCPNDPNQPDIQTRRCIERKKRLR